MNFRVIESARNAALQTLLDALNAGSGPGIVEIYNGTQPANASVAVSTQTKLGTLTLADPAGSIASGVLTFDAITDDVSADATGTASWARFKDSDGNTVADCDVTASGGGGALTFNTVSFVIGGPVKITSFAVSFPGA